MTVILKQSCFYSKQIITVLLNLFSNAPYIFPNKLIYGFKGKKIIIKRQNYFNDKCFVYKQLRN